MIPVCIYQDNRGLGPCAGPVSPIRVAQPRTLAWTGLQDLAERLEPDGEAPGVCQAHQPRAEANGYVVGRETPAPSPRPRPARTPKARTAPKPAKTE